jgi:hypothetical protein
MGKPARGSRNSSDLTDLITDARTMSAARFILEVQSRGHDAVQVLNELTPETLGLTPDALGLFE